MAVVLADILSSAKAFGMGKHSKGGGGVSAWKVLFFFSLMCMRWVGTYVPGMGWHHCEMNDRVSE